MLANTTEFPPQLLCDPKILRIAPYLRREQGGTMCAVPIGCWISCHSGGHRLIRQHRPGGFASSLFQPSLLSRATAAGRASNGLSH